MPVTCYLCGRDFGSRSIAIHVPHCRKRWEDEQRKIPKSQRRSPPTPPDQLDEVLQGKLEGEDLRKFNEAAMTEWNRAVLEECEYCGRTFLPNKLAKHQKSCTQEKPMTNPNKVKGVATKLESLVSYPKQKKRKVRAKQSEMEDSDETLSCNCHGGGSCSVMELQNDTPTLQDFTDIICENEVLEDSEMSKQLLFLMNYFIKMKRGEKTPKLPNIF